MAAVAPWRSIATTLLLADFGIAKKISAEEEVLFDFVGTAVRLGGVGVGWWWRWLR